MAGENTMTTLNNNVKIIYGDKLKYLLPQGLWLYPNFEFKTAKKLGQAFYQPIVLKHEHGFTYAASRFTGVSTGSAPWAPSGTVVGVPYVTAAPGFIENANIDGTQIFGRTLLDFESASRAASSKASFVDSVGYVLENLDQSAKRRLEIAMYLGQTPLAVADTGTTTTNFIVTAATWAPGLWAGQEGAPIEVTSNTRTPVRGTSTISAINFTTRTITFAGAIASTVATDYLWFKSAASIGTAGGTGPAYPLTAANILQNECVGLHTMLNAPTSVHGITCATYSLWTPNSQDVGSANMNLEAVEDAAAKIINRGGGGATYKLLMAPANYAKFINSLSGLRRLNKEDGSRYTIGAEDITIFAGGLKIVLVSWAYCMEGFAYLINPDDFMRIGSTDLTYKVPGRGDDLFRLSDGAGSYEMQLYSLQAPACTALCRQCIFINIVPQ